MKAVFIECLKPQDYFENTSELKSLSAISELLGHQALVYNSISLIDFKAFIDFVCEIKLKNDESMILYLGGHGSSKGIKVGTDLLSWEELASLVEKVTSIKSCRDKIGVILSACYSKEQKITSIIENDIRDKEIYAPVFVMTGLDNDVELEESLMNTAILLKEMKGKNKFEDICIKDIIRRINISKIGNIGCYYWSKEQQHYVYYE